MNPDWPAEKRESYEVLRHLHWAVKKMEEAWKCLNRARTKWTHELQWHDLDRVLLHQFLREVQNLQSRMRDANNLVVAFRGGFHGFDEDHWDTDPMDETE